MNAQGITDVKSVAIKVDFISNKTGKVTDSRNLRVSVKTPMVEALRKVGVDVHRVPFPEPGASTFLYLLEGQTPVPLAKPLLPMPIEKDLHFQLKYDQPLLTFPVEVYIHD